jgi:gluconokinase
MEPRSFLGVDLGTTGTRAIVFSAAGAVQGQGHRDYPMLMPKPMWAEQDPHAILAAVVAAIRDAVAHANVSRHEIAAIGFSAAMHSLIAVDAKGHPLTNSIIWADNRSVVQAERLKQGGAGHSLYRRTGTPIHPMSPLTKLLWMRESAPETFRQAAKFISIKEYVLHHLCGHYVVDYAIASATGLFNLERLNWDAEALVAAGLRPEHLSEPVSTTYTLRGLKRRYAEHMGLGEHTPVVVGASDGVLANLGVGAIERGQVAVTVGTSAAVRTVVPSPTTDPQERTFCYALTDKHWVIGGASNNGGIVLRWLRDECCGVEVEQAKQRGLDPYEVMIEVASTVPIGSEGLLCLPFLAGERAPYWNAKARGAFIGLSLHHTRAHIIRAVLEGTLFNLDTINRALHELAGEPQEIRAAGGFARSPEWRQMLADIFACEVLIPEVYESSSFGAAVLAMHAVGALGDLAEVQRFMCIAHRHRPNPDASARYRELLEIHTRIYDRVAEDLGRLADYQLRSGRSVFGDQPRRKGG